MWYPAALGEPDTEPISLSDAKAHLRVSHDDDDSHIAGLITAARDYVERYCGIAVAQRALSISCDHFADLERLPVAPISTVSSVGYVGPDGIARLLEPETYELQSDGLEPSIALRSDARWPRPRRMSRVTVTATIGFPTLPGTLRHAMLLYIASAYDARENAPRDGWTVLDNLLCNFRRGA